MRPQNRNLHGYAHNSEGIIFSVTMSIEIVQVMKVLIEQQQQVQAFIE